MGTGLDGVGLEVAVHAEALAGSTEQGEQDDGEGVEQQQPVAALRIGDPHRAEAQAEAQVLGVPEAGLHSPPFRVELDDLRRVTVAGHQGSFMSRACTHTTAPTGRRASVTAASLSLRARPPCPIQLAAGRVVPSAALTLVLPLSRIT